MVVVPPPKVLQPVVKTSWIIGQTEVLVSGQFNKTFPKIGIPVHPPFVVILVMSIFTSSEVIPGLLIPHGSAGGSKLCK